MYDIVRTGHLHGVAHKSGHRALRRGRWSQAGQVYLVPAVTRGRQRVFDDFEPARAACRAMHAFDAHADAKLLAWVLMPDHAHWLLQTGLQEPLPHAVNRLKASSARNTNLILGRTGSLWARGFHDRALRQEEDLRCAARYVITNPLRAGLGRRVGDYPFWNCVYV